MTGAGSRSGFCATVCGDKNVPAKTALKNAANAPDIENRALSTDKELNIELPKNEFRSSYLITILAI